MIKYIIGGVLLAMLLLTVLAFGAPNSKISETPLDEDNKKVKRSVCALLALTIAVAILPMGWSPIWNGEKPEHRNQYELMAESLIEGKLYIDYDDIDHKLLELENPYDINARKNVKFHYDHAFYNGKYYMYFGVVPAVLLFVPYRLITGTALNSYHASQVFTAFFILGVFVLFKKLGALFFKELNFMLLAVLSCAVSLMSVWYVVDCPSLYCLPIISGICFEIWSLYFFIKAVFDSESENKSIGFATRGSLFGALTFGCRPTIALANLIVLPLLILFIKKSKVNFRLILKLTLAATPYVITGALLMAYNYLRFDNVFEFGQTYQLTNTDQSQYSDILSNFSIYKEIKGIAEFLIFKDADYNVFIKLGTFITFPITLVVFKLANKKIFCEIKAKKLSGFVLISILTVIVIMLADMLWSPFFVPRYRLDMHWLLGILSFVTAGFIYKLSDNKKRINKIVFSLSAFTIIASVLLILVPFEYNFTYNYFYG